MRRLLVGICGGLTALWAARAQVTLELLLDQQQFLRDESMVVQVRIINRSGQTLRLGQDPDWLTFSIEHRTGHPVLRLGDVPVQGAFEVESATVADRKFDLMPYFDLSVPGRYRVSAFMKIKDWGATVASEPREFDIIRGAKVWEEEFGVPAPGGLPEVRKYILQRAAHIRQLRLYARVTDPAENRTFRVVSLGPLTSFSRYEAQIDKDSHLHVLFQTGARTFAYTVLDPDGTVLLRQTYLYGASRPRFQIDAQGKIGVVGGVRQPAPDDWPPAVTQAQPTGPGQTNAALTNVTGAPSLAPSTNPPAPTERPSPSPKPKGTRAPKLRQ